MEENAILFAVSLASQVAAHPGMAKGALASGSPRETTDALIHCKVIGIGKSRMFMPTTRS